LDGEGNADICRSAVSLSTGFRLCDDDEAGGGKNTGWSLLVDGFFDLLLRSTLLDDDGGRLPLVPTAPVDPFAAFRLPLLFVAYEFVDVMAASGIELFVTEFDPL